MNGRFLHKLIALLFVVATLSLTGSRAAAQTAMEKLRVVYTVIAPTQAHVWTAKEMGLYAKQGLDVELVLLVGRR